MEGRWEVFKILKPSDMRSIKTCAAYNRNENCTQGKWHTSSKRISIMDRISKDQSFRRPTQHGNGYREELRVHSCTLCMKALGILSMHNVLECPWIYEDGWGKFASDKTDPKASENSSMSTLSSSSSSFVLNSK